MIEVDGLTYTAGDLESLVRAARRAFRAYHVAGPDGKGEPYAEPDAMYALGMALDAPISRRERRYQRTADTRARMAAGARRTSARKRRDPATGCFVAQAEEPSSLKRRTADGR